jgi:hypothetical protein
MAWSARWKANTVPGAAPAAARTSSTPLHQPARHLRPAAATPKGSSGTPGTHRYQLTPLRPAGRGPFTKTHGRLLAPGLAALDPHLPARPPQPPGYRLATTRPHPGHLHHHGAGSRVPRTRPAAPSPGPVPHPPSDPNPLAPVRACGYGYPDQPRAAVGQLATGRPTSTCVLPLDWSEVWWQRLLAWRRRSPGSAARPLGS